MWPFKKRKNIDELLSPFRLEYEEVEVDIGKTLIKLKFNDSREFRICVYGEPNQYVSSGGWDSDKGRASDPVASDEILIYHSSRKAQDWIRHLSGESHGTFIDDPINTKKVMIGVPESATILTDLSYLMKFQKAKVVKR